MLLAAMAGHGQQLSIQFDTTWPGFSCRFLPDGFRVCDGTPEGKILVYLIDRIDSLQHELALQRELLQFNTDMGNYYIRKVDSLEKRPYFWFSQWPGGIQYDPGIQIDPGFWNPGRPIGRPNSVWIDSLLPIKEIRFGSSDGSVSVLKDHVDTAYVSDSIIFVPRVTPKKKKKK